jgi:ABC-type multidrug transport system permease subunit
MLSVGLANTAVVCSDIELLHVNPPDNMTCGDYFAPYISYAGGYVSEATKSATTGCEFCSASDTNFLLMGLNSSYSNRWRNFGLMWVYIIVNVIGAILLYYLARVPKKAKKEKMIELPEEKAVVQPDGEIAETAVTKV